MKEIQLSKGGKNRGKYFALVDDEDYDFLTQWSWFYHKGRYTYYAARYKNKKRIYMHRIILNAQKGQMIDHKDQNGLNCQKNNLRFCTYTQNVCNRKKYYNVEYKGICKRNRRNKSTWEAYIYVAHTRKYLGSYSTPKLAAIAYDDAAKIYHGEFASLNFKLHEN